MGWENVTYNDIDLNARPQVAPGPGYTLQLLGAYESKFRPGQVDVSFMVVDDGPEKGKKIYLEIPNPDDQPWAKELYARLVSKMTGELPVAPPLEQLPQIAQNGHSRITADVFTKEFTKKDGTPGSKSTIAAKSIRPAA